MRDARTQIVLFFVLAFVLSWFPWYMGLGAEVFAAGPSLAAFVLALAFGGWRGFKQLLIPFGRWRASWLWWSIALFGTAVLFLVGLLVFALFGGAVPPFIMLSQELPLVGLYLVLVVLMPLNGPIGEEFGWRGYALPRLQAGMGPLWASLIIGTVWGVWHLPSFFAANGVIADLTGQVGFIFLVPCTLGTIANSVIMTWLYNRTGKSALIAGIVWHAATDFWAPVLLSGASLAAVQAGEYLPTIGLGLYMAVIAVLVAAALGLIVLTRGRLGLADADSATVTAA